jgi:regulator of protease activity HflC (stomatin/prohibitin superfamily)
MSATSSPPPLFRLLLWLGGPFGWYYIPESHACLVKRMEQYHRLEKGPGFKRYNTFTETLGSQFKIGLEPFAYQFDNLPASDGLQLGLKFALNYEFFPEKVGKLTTVAKLGLLPKDVFCEIVSNRVRRALLNIIPAYTADAICRGQEFANIEKQLVINTNELLTPLGITLSGPLVLQVIPPDSLRARYEGVAQRRLNVESLREYQSTDVNRALAAEFIEGMAGRGGDQYLDVGNVLGTVSGQIDEADRRSFLTPPPKKK